MRDDLAAFLETSRDAISTVEIELNTAALATLEEARGLLDSGKRDEAQTLLTTSLKTNPDARALGELLDSTRIRPVSMGATVPIKRSAESEPEDGGSADRDRRTPPHSQMPAGYAAVAADAHRRAASAAGRHDGRGALVVEGDVVDWRRGGGGSARRRDVTCRSRSTTPRRNPAAVTTAWRPSREARRNAIDRDDDAGHHANDIRAGATRDDGDGDPSDTDGRDIRQHRERRNAVDSQAGHRSAREYNDAYDGNTAGGAGRPGSRAHREADVRG